MAYTAYAFVGTQGIAGKASYLRGYIGTQNDKANDALDVLMGLVNDMPKNPERIDNIKSYLRQAMLTSHPSFRNKAMELVDLGYRGYTDDPAKENLPKVDALTFDDIVKFYEENIKDKPYCISIMGNPKNIDLKRLEKIRQGSETERTQTFQHEGCIVLTLFYPLSNPILFPLIRGTRNMKRFPDISVPNAGESYFNT